MAWYRKQDIKHAGNRLRPALDWMLGTGLRPYLDALETNMETDQERAAFTQAYGENVAKAYPPAEDGHTLYPFNRLFIVAHK